MEVEMDDAGEDVHDENDLQLLERLGLGSDSDDDVFPPLEHNVEDMDMRDSDDDTYDPANTDHDEYF
jgi:hypothetical protein